MQVIAGGDRGGAETFFVSLNLALHQAGLEQRLIMRRNALRAALFRDGGVNPLELRFGGRLDWHTPWALRREVASYRPDIVITWMNRATQMMPRGIFAGGDFLHIGRIGGYYDMKYYRKCDRMLVMTQGLANHAVAGGWSLARVDMIRNFARLEEGPPVNRAEFETPEEAPLLLALGRLHEAKALDVLLRALVREPRAYLWIAGEGPLQGELSALTQRLDLTGRVRFLGWRTDRKPLLQCADICVFPSRYEPFGTVILEAWAAGTPLVVSRAAGALEVVEDGETGLMVAVDDEAALAGAITQVIDDPNLARRMVDTGRERYEAEFSESACVRNYIDLFERLMTAKDRRAPK